MLLIYKYINLFLHYLIIKLIMKIKYLLPLILIAIFAITACKKSNPNPSSGNTGKTGTTGTTGTTGSTGTTGTTGSTGTTGTTGSTGTTQNTDGNDIYITGYVTDADGYQFAAYWKNGVMHQLSDKTQSVAMANAIVVVGDDVYVAGQIGGNVVYWKNGIRTTVGKGYLNSSASVLSVYNGDVYIAGFTSTNFGTQSSAVYWKNTTPVYLTDPTTGYSTANAIVVNENGVYVVGATNKTSDIMNAIYWKDNVPYKLSENMLISDAKSIYVQGNDVYITGYVETSDYSFSAVYWKNGNINKVTTSGIGQINNLIVSGGDIYLGGYDTTNGYRGVAYWKNGVEIFHSPYYGPINTVNVAVEGSNTYIVDPAYNIYQGGYWENGVFKNLNSSILTTTTSIFVVHHN